MNVIRTNLGETNLTCIDYDVILQKVSNITVEIKVINTFFDAKSYTQDQKM